MRDMIGSAGGNAMSDREIAEDILAGQKYLSNYYYAPAILEAGDAELRSSFQEIHKEVASAAKDVFDYLHSKGWYQVRQADAEDIADLRNAVHQSRGSISQESSIGGTDMSMNQGQQGWTGTQYGEGQSGMGQSSIGQGARWGGEPSWMGSMGGMSSQQFGQQQANLPSWTRGGMGGRETFGPQQSGIGSQAWTGTQYGEGQSGFGQSSLSQGVRWGGEPSWMGSTGTQQFGQQQANLPSWTRGGMGSQQTFGAQQSGIGSQAWTGTQYGEGQSGLGQSSLGQGVRWGGEPSWNSGIGGQYQSQQQGTLPNWTRGGIAGHEGGSSGQQGGFGGQGQMGNVWNSSFQGGPSGAGWTGTQSGEGQSGFGPSSLGGYGTGNWQTGSFGQRQGQQWNQGGQSNWQQSQ